MATAGAAAVTETALAASRRGMTRCDPRGSAMRAAVVQLRAHRSHRLARNAPEVAAAGTMRVAVVQLRAHRSRRLVRNAPEVVDAGTVRAALVQFRAHRSHRRDTHRRLLRQVSHAQSLYGFGSISTRFARLPLQACMLNALLRCLVTSAPTMIFTPLVVRQSFGQHRQKASRHDAQVHVYNTHSVAIVLGASFLAWVILQSLSIA